MNKKAIGPVVATSLLLVVAVIAITGFSSWYTTYSSKTFIQVETKDQNDISIETISNNYLYVKNSKEENISLDSINVGGIDCDIAINLSQGVNKIDIEECMENSGSNNVLLITNEGVIEKEIYVKNFQKEIKGCTNISDGIVGLWHMDNSLQDESINSNDGTGYGSGILNGFYMMNNNWLDSSGNGYNGGPIGPVFSTSSKIGSHAGSFDGINDYLSLSDTNFRFSNKSFSVEGWFYPTTLSSGDAPTYVRLFSKDYWPNYWFVVNAHTDGSVEMNMLDESSNTITINSNSGKVKVNQWNHIGVVIDRDSNEVKIFINGTDETINGDISSITGKFDIPGRNFLISTTWARFPGRIDNFGIYTSSLTQEDMSNRFNSGTGTESLLKKKYIKNSGVNNYSTYFNEKSDYINLGTLPEINFDNSYSLSVWFKNIDEGPDAKAYGTIFTKNNDGSGYGDIFHCYILTSNSKLGCRVGNGTNEYYMNSDNPITDKNWHNLVFTYDSTNKEYKIYIDKILNDNRTMDPNWTPSNSAAKDLIIGKWPTYDSFFSGELDDFAIINYTLTQKQIDEIYDLGILGKPICNP